MYTQIYCARDPDFLARYCAQPAMQRLASVGMHCGCEYSALDVFRQVRGDYSRLTHSIGTARIVWRFTASPAQTLAALFHDIATPCFAHVIDFMRGDHMRQESTEQGIREILLGNSIGALLQRDAVRPEDVEDYHRYPIADNNTPRLSADRLEYTLGNAYLVQREPLEAIRALYGDLAVTTNESDLPELAFCSCEAAAQFTRIALRNARWFVSDEDRFLMQYLADLVRLALKRGTLTQPMLWTDEPSVIRALESDALLSPCWAAFRRIRSVRASAEPVAGYCVRIAAKKRWIDPLVCMRGGAQRISSLDAAVRDEIRAFLAERFDRWIYAEEDGACLSFPQSGASQGL